MATVAVLRAPGRVSVRLRRSSPAPGPPVSRRASASGRAGCVADRGRRPAPRAALEARAKEAPAVGPRRASARAAARGPRRLIASSSHSGPAAAGGRTSASSAIAVSSALSPGQAVPAAWPAAVPGQPALTGSGSASPDVGTCETRRREPARGRRQTRILRPGVPAGRRVRTSRRRTHAVGRGRRRGHDPVAEGGAALPRRGHDAAGDRGRAGRPQRAGPADRRPDRALPLREPRRLPPGLLAGAVDARRPGRLGAAGVRVGRGRGRLRRGLPGVVLHPGPAPRGRPGPRRHRRGAGRGAGGGRGRDRHPGHAGLRHGPRIRRRRRARARRAPGRAAPGRRGGDRAGARRGDGLHRARRRPARLRRRVPDGGRGGAAADRPPGREQPAAGDRDLRRRARRRAHRPRPVHCGRSRADPAAGRPGSR